jgi:hypothetical protein
MTKEKYIKQLEVLKIKIILMETIKIRTSNKTSLIDQEIQEVHNFPEGDLNHRKEQILKKLGYTNLAFSSD